MKTLLAVTIALLCLALPVQTQAQAQPAAADPAALVRSFYVANFNDQAMPLSARLARLLDAASANSKKINGPVQGIDFAWHMNAQDANDGWEKTARISEIKRADERASVRATFRNNNRDNELHYELVRENGRWQVDDVASVRGDKWVLSQMLMRGAKEK